MRGITLLNLKTSRSIVATCVFSLKEYSLNQFLAKKNINTISQIIFLLCIAMYFLHGNVFAASKKELFNVYDIESPFTITQPVIALNLFNSKGVDNTSNQQHDTKELIVIGIDDNNDAWLAIYAMNVEINQFVLVDALPIDEKYFAYDISDSHQTNGDVISSHHKTISKLYLLSRDEVVSYQPENINALNNTDTDTDTNTEIDIANYKSDSFFKVEQSIKSMYLVESSTFLSRKKFIKDLNHDGLDDIVLDDFEHLNVWIAKPKAESVYRFQALSLTPTVSLNRGGVTFKPQTIYYGDFNFDQLTDIAWVEKGEINYFPQQKEGFFPTSHSKVSLNESIYGINWWDIKTAEGEGLDQSELIHRVVEKIQDVNGDGIIDIIVKYTQSSGVLDRSNNYEFYFGQKNTAELLSENSLIRFDKTANTTIKADGTLTGLSIIDINKDNRFEILLSSFELSLGNIIGALLSGGIEQNVLLFSLNDEDRFNEKPVTEKEVELNFSLSKGQSGSPVVILSDVTGDGLQDLILSDDDVLKVYKGLKNNKKRKFWKKPIKQKLPISKEGSHFISYDINNDNKQDFVVSYGRLDEENLRKTFSVILTK